MEDVREVGAEWLCKQSLEELGVGVIYVALNGTKTTLKLL